MKKQTMRKERKRKHKTCKNITRQKKHKEKKKRENIRDKERWERNNFMASTRNKNNPGNYQLEQSTLIQNREYLLN